MGFDYVRYIKHFNTGEDAELVERYFTDDIVFAGSSRELHGKAALLDFLRWAHNGVRELIRAQTVIQDETHIFAEIDMDFVCSADRPDFPFKPLKAGEMITVKFFVNYHLRGDKIARLASATWPADYNVTKPVAKLGAGEEAKRAYNDYAAAFSNADFKRFGQYYTYDVELSLGSVAPMKGRDAIVDFYTRMFRTVREHLTVHEARFSDEMISVDVTSTFTASADAPDFVVAPLRAGQSVSVDVRVDYALRDGQISRIGVTRRSDVRRPSFETDLRSSSG